jgi:hypothetical protein
MSLQMIALPFFWAANNGMNVVSIINLTFNSVDIQDEGIEGGMG